MTGCAAFGQERGEVLIPIEADEAIQQVGIVDPDTGTPIRLAAIPSGSRRFREHMPLGTYYLESDVIGQGSFSGAWRASTPVWSTPDPTNRSRGRMHRDRSRPSPRAERRHRPRWTSNARRRQRHTHANAKPGNAKPTVQPRRPPHRGDVPRRGQTGYAAVTERHRPRAATAGRFADAAHITEGFVELTVTTSQSGRTRLRTGTRQR